MAPNTKKEMYNREFGHAYLPVSPTFRAGTENHAENTPRVRHSGGKEWASGSPRRDCDVHIRSALQAYGEGPGRGRSGPTSILSRGQH